MKSKSFIILSICLTLSVFHHSYLISSVYNNKFKYDSVTIAKTQKADFSTLANFGGTEIRNVILVLADGVGINHILASRMILYGPDGRMYCERFPITGLSNTSPLDESYITDSGASATAIII